MGSQKSHLAQITKIQPSVAPSYTPTTDQLLADFDVSDTASYNFASAPTSILSIHGTHNGTLTATPVNEDLGTASTFGYGTDSDGKYLHSNPYGAVERINVSSSINLTNWSIKAKMRYQTFNNQYNRYFGTNGYRIELVIHGGNYIYVYDGGWRNTGVRLPNDGAYHDIDITYNNSPKRLKVYLNGVLSYSSTSYGRSISTSIYYVLGSADNRSINAYMNRFLLHGKELTQTEITANLG